MKFSHKGYLMRRLSTHQNGALTLPLQRKRGCRHYRYQLKPVRVRVGTLACSINDSKSGPRGIVQFVEFNPAAGN